MVQSSNKSNFPSTDRSSGFHKSTLWATLYRRKGKSGEGGRKIQIVHFYVVVSFVNSGNCKLRLRGCTYPCLNFRQHSSNSYLLHLVYHMTANATGQACSFVLCLAAVRFFFFQFSASSFLRMIDYAPYGFSFFCCHVICLYLSGDGGSCVEAGLVLVKSPQSENDRHNCLTVKSKC